MINAKFPIMVKVNVLSCICSRATYINEQGLLLYKTWTFLPSQIGVSNDGVCLFKAQTFFNQLLQGFGESFMISTRRHCSEAKYTTRSIQFSTVHLLGSVIFCMCIISQPPVRENKWSQTDCYLLKSTKHKPSIKPTITNGSCHLKSFNHT